MVMKYYIFKIVTLSFIFFIQINVLVCEIKNNPVVADTSKNFMFITSILQDDNIILCCGYHLGIFKSTDNGLTWSLSNNGLVHDQKNNIVGIKKNEGVYFAWTLKGRIYISNDTANNWQLFTSYFDSSNLSINDLEFQDSTIFLSSNEGIYFSKNNGISWNTIDKLERNNYGCLYIENETLFVTNNTIYYNYNNIWDSIKNIPKVKFLFSDIAFLGSKIFIVSDLGIYSTLDYGEKWENITFNMDIPQGGYEGIIRIFSTTDRIYVCKDDGLYLLIENDKYWLKCCFDLKLKEQPLPWVIKKINGFYMLGSNGMGLFRSEDGILFSQVKNILLNGER